MNNKQQLEQDHQHFNWTELDFKQDLEFSDVNVQIQLWILASINLAIYLDTLCSMKISISLAKQGFE